MANIERYLELRQEEDGFVAGTVLPYNDEAVIAGGQLRERFLPGSVIFDDVLLTPMHNRGMNLPLARTGGGGLELIDTPDSLEMRAQIPDTASGRDTQLLIQRGVIRGLSAEFIPLKERIVNGVREISKARLYNIAFVPRPAYRGSTLHRDDESAQADSAWKAWM